MRATSNLVSRKLNNLDVRQSEALSISMKPDRGLLPEGSILKKFTLSRLSPKIRAKSLLISAVIISGILSACLTTLNGEEVKADDSSVEKVSIYRNPFSLPSGVRFEEKAGTVGTYSEYSKWKEGDVANSVSGIFQSGNIVKANINGVWVKEGDWAGEEQVIAIETENVVLLGKENSKRNLPLRGAESD